jgi:hypothetical protein
MSFLRDGMTVDYASPDDIENRARIIAQPDGDFFCKGTPRYYERPESQAEHMRSFTARMAVLANDVQGIFRLLNTATLMLWGLTGVLMPYPVLSAMVEAWHDFSLLTLFSTFFRLAGWWIGPLVGWAARTGCLWWVRRFIASNLAMPAAK